MTTTTDASTEWQLPIEEMLQMHRERIDGNEDQVPAMVEAWFIGDHSPAWMTWVQDTGDIPTRDAGLFAVDVMAASCGADFIVFSFDTHMTSLPVNPKTNKPWGPGEMQAMCDEEGFCETGQMRDNLVVAIVRRSDRKLYFHSIAYHFHKGELQFFPETHMSEWEDESDNVTMTGTIPNSMRNAMARPASAELLMKMIGISAEDLGFKPEDARIVRLHEILAGIRVLNTLARAEGLPQMYACAIPSLSEEEARIVQETANRSGLEVRGVS